MFSELPKLFDRDFAIGFSCQPRCWPVEIWIALRGFGFFADAPRLEVLTTTAIAAVVVWLFAVALLALNYPILRVFEGYPSQLRKWHPIKSREAFWRRRFQRTIDPVLNLREHIETDVETPAPDYFDRLRMAVEDYPFAAEQVLPTRFGNVFRALEVYSYIIYGMDAIPVWPRLQAVMPKEFREQLGEAKSLLDFFVNVSVAGTITTTIYFVLAAWTRQLPILWLPVVAIVLAIASHRFSIDAVRQYGVHVKSAFDLYRGELAKQLGLVLPRNARDERKMWFDVGFMIAHRSQRFSDRLDPFRTRPPPDSDR